MSLDHLDFQRSLLLMQRVRQKRAGWAAIVAATLCSTVFAIAVPWPMKILVDNVLGRAPMPHLLASLLDALPAGAGKSGAAMWLALAGLAIFAIGSFIDVLLTYLWIRVGQGMVYDLAAELFSRVQRRSLLFHGRSSVGDSMARITGDSWCIYTIVDTLLFTPFHAILISIAMLVLMYRLNVSLTLVSIAVAPLMAFASLPFGKRLRNAARVQREFESQIQSHVQQTLRGIPVVQAFAQEDREHSRFRAFAVAAIAAQQRSVLVSSFATLGSGLVAALGTAIVLWYGSRLVLGGLSVGTLLVFLAYLGSLQVQLKSLTSVYTALQTVGAKVDRVCEMLESEPEIADRPGAIALCKPAVGHIVFDCVTFGYEPARPVLKNLSLEAVPGDVIALIGSTGAGKTTMMSMIPRFFDPWNGRILLDGHDLRSLQLRSLREQVSLVLQEPYLFGCSIIENIALGRPGASREEIRRVAREANADEFISHLPHGYDTIIGQSGATLSGGERQRLSIARALLKPAPILILDEPTSALDVETEHLIVQALERLMQGRTTFVIAHRLSTIRRAKKIAVLEDGRICELGSHEELVERDGAYARFLSFQSGLPGSSAVAHPAVVANVEGVAAV